MSDALDRLGYPGSAKGIAPLNHDARVCGRAFTVRYVPTRAHPGTVGDYIDDVEAGSVVVLENQGRTDCTVWGDILTAMAVQRELAGTVINGVCRDIDRALELGYPIYSKGRFMRTGKDRVEAADVQVPVALGDATAAPGDIVLGDADGVLVIDATVAEPVLEAAIEIAERESQLLEMALEGSSLRAARQQHGYHTLQRKQ